MFHVKKASRNFVIMKKVARLSKTGVRKENALKLRVKIRKSFSIERYNRSVEQNQQIW